MALDPDSAFEGLALVIDAIRDSPKLQSWFQELGHMPSTARRETITRTTQEMHEQGETAQLVTAFGLLSHPPLFAAVVSALRDCGVRV